MPQLRAVPSDPTPDEIPPAAPPRPEPLGKRHRYETLRRWNAGEDQWNAVLEAALRFARERNIQAREIILAMRSRRPGLSAQIQRWLDADPAPRR